MPTGTSLNFQGVVYKSTMKPAKLDEDGFPISQDLEVVLRIPLTDGVRTKLADLSRLQNGQTTYIALHDVQFNLDLTGEKPKGQPKPKKGSSAKAGKPDKVDKQPPVGAPAH